MIRTVGLRQKIPNIPNTHQLDELLRSHYYSNKGNLVHKYDPKMKSKEKHYYLLKCHTDMVFITIVQREASTSLYRHKGICYYSI